MLLVFARIASRTLPQIAIFFSSSLSLPFVYLWNVANPRIAVYRVNKSVLSECKRTKCARAGAHFSIENSLAFFQLMMMLTKELHLKFMSPILSLIFSFKNIIVLYTKRRELIIFPMTLCAYMFIWVILIAITAHFEGLYTTVTSETTTTTTVLTRLNWCSDFQYACYYCAIQRTVFFSETLSLLSLFIFINWIDYWWTMLIYDSFSTAISATC